ncbi:MULTISPECIES: TolC family protein [unclassified Sphingobium]|uniref:TolC family protein n=1 Tax=unclassified Sphingobium TaxID=2611147 RepID=UPI000D15AC9E|nr:MULTISPECIES: TolC family protein [unclassified Sphingobium]PSO10429.1 transporter [Sphingobium sp. AEW4]TWD03650.1 cobalt-zinc-cadmium efflux system outer membrane protein [Sphingobium sp. AEW010]TWD21147.1 cobalt-zinc-cadmium efflux system outer membrane protein [Sphingobium sp. AEW013]TWD23789.1 cobalt-zinc-cadmium efflux system outer membrane protein [Sphingobium sp. AEW001]
MYRTIAAVMVAASLASTAGAQTTTPPGIPAATTSSQSADAFSLENALAAGGMPSIPSAVLDNGAASGGSGSAALPSVAAATAGVDAATAARRVAGLRPNPEVQAQVENVAGTGVYKGLRSSETTVGVALPLELGGKRPARVALATARLTRAQIQSEIARADLRLRITQLYIDAAAAERRAEVLSEQAGIANNAFRVSSERVKAGDVGPIEQQRADVLRINAQVAADSAARQAQAARANLETLLSAPVTGPLDRAWFERIDGYGPPRPIDVDGTLALVAAEADVRTADAQVRVARSLRVPDLTVSASARRLAATNDTAAVVGISIPIPFFNNGSAFVAQSRSEQTQAIALRNLAVIDTRQQIASAQTEVANAAATARAAGGPGLAAAQEAARIARIGWTQGKFDQIALLDAERTLSQTRQTYVDALAAYHDAQARLDRLTTPAPTISGDDR